MRKIILLLLLLNNTVRAQYTTWDLITEIDPVVSEPLYGWFIIDFKTDGSILQRNDSSQSWTDIYKTVGLKNPDKKYILYAEFENPLNTGLDTTKYYECNYIKDGNGQIIEANKMTYRGNYRYYKIKFFYSSNILDSSEEYENINGANKLKTVTHFKYDSLGKRIKDSLVWHYTPNPVFMFNYTYTYDNNNRCIEFKTNNSQNFFGYFADGKMKKNEYFWWNGSSFEKSKEKNFTYYPDGTIDSLIEYSVIGNNIVPKQRTKHYYNSKKTLIALVIQSYSDTTGFINYDSIPLRLLSNNNYDTSYSYEWKSNKWALRGYRYIFDKMSPLNIHNPEKSTLKIYPNPAQSYITVELPENSAEKEISITDITGKTIRRFPVNDLVIEIPLDIPPGIYFLRSGAMVARFVKQ